MLQIESIFQSGMILQHGKPVRIWGKASPDEEIAVAIQNRKIIVKADAYGKWSGEIPSLEVSFSETMHISCNSCTIALEDIAVGEVWLAGGQSNMEYWMHYEKHFQEERQNCQNGNVRIYTVPETAYEGQDKDFDYSLMGIWRKASAEDLEYMSAVSYYFAKELQRELQVPVGVIVCSWGGTFSSSWMREESVKTYGRVWWDIYLKDKGNRTEAELVEKFRRSPDGDRSHPFENAFTDFSLSQTRTPEEFESFFKSMDGSFDIDSILLLKKPGVLYENMLKRIASYTVRGVLWYQGESDDGEETAHLYEKMLKVLINDWRVLWEEELPFLVVQLPGYEGMMGVQNLHYDIIRECQERVAQTVDNVYLASISDAGEEYDIHPRDKKIVGHRLALLARGHVYGEELLCDAPAMRTVEISEKEIRIWFAHTGEGLRCPNGYELPLTIHADGESIEYEFEIQGALLRLKTKKPLSGSVKISFARTKYYKVELRNASGIPAVPFEKVVTETKDGGMSR